MIWISRTMLLFFKSAYGKVMHTQAMLRLQSNQMSSCRPLQRKTATTKQPHQLHRSQIDLFYPLSMHVLFLVFLQMQSRSMLPVAAAANIDHPGLPLIFPRYKETRRTILYALWIHQCRRLKGTKSIQFARIIAILKPCSVWKKAPAFLSSSTRKSHLLHANSSSDTYRECFLKYRSTAHHLEISPSPNGVAVSLSSLHHPRPKSAVNNIMSCKQPWEIFVKKFLR